MATEPRTIKIQLKHEHTEGISERYPTTSVTYLITASEAQIMVECDLHLRRQEVADPEQAERRSLHEICDELGKHDYNNAKQHLRNTTYRSVSAKDDDDEIPVIDAVASSAEDPRSRVWTGRRGEYVQLRPDEAWVTQLEVREALASLDPKDRLVVVGIHMHGYTQSQIARVLGISQPAVAKRLKKDEARLRELLS
ncbi:RNA polymerase factor sigma 70 [Corynebacterium pseudotuberculosis]|uniref:sigma factor-like helix-turn-helix DNA-binding protein n=1 Tax=Corynebacterium pseudotuberculosis TaxID=1719 RepID=UPI0001DD485C|nr:sigma factor-like helix-turn-helix DNA-binding protein [Corynebacterium pseudotuberculosis]ADL21328.1 RNA polymerase subunit sigma-70 [Corynebacterium pseudotuberculosis 1002]AJC14189.1 RNA polymerase factor sigma 70 [Corynebacterium pseudotuberculosis]AKJ56131.1 RNA polymerase factor sigma 70 [Corynebacterium pseudotuberculosis]ALM77750.1 RNA polymerase factor sigma 70 [Corynebacterium pseudotuberculosis]ANK56820.1 DNA-directed RNA polymerase sigma-70 factor [Corynebacterium pseudotubercul